MKLVLLLFVICRVSVLDATNEDDLEIERQVKIMNKPPVKTFVTKEGDTIDCIDINKQPALDHPLLKNHRVQVEPKLNFNGFGKSSPNAKSVQFGLREPCPIGTVPIPRVTKADLIRAKSLPQMPSVTSMEDDSIDPDQHVVLLRDNFNLTAFGCHGITSVYNLSVAQGQFSSHNMWLQDGPTDHLSMILAGWRVSPQLYGDTLSRLFIYWTGDGYRDGCYNTLCPGFVQVDREVTTGYPLHPTSTYGGEQYVLSIQVDQDNTTGNWWLLCGGDQSVKVGYWPKELFVNLRNGAEYTAWGGIGRADSNGVCPPMGSGHKPDGNYTHATFFEKLSSVRDKPGGFASPPSVFITERVDKSNVYGLKNDKFVEGMGYTINYGGPGGYCRG